MLEIRHWEEGLRKNVHASSKLSACQPGNDWWKNKTSELLHDSSILSLLQVFPFLLVIHFMKLFKTPTIIIFLEGQKKKVSVLWALFLNSGFLFRLSKQTSKSTENSHYFWESHECTEIIHNLPYNRMRRIWPHPLRTTWEWLMARIFQKHWRNYAADYSILKKAHGGHRRPLINGLKRTFLPFNS